MSATAAIQVQVIDVIQVQYQGAPGTFQVSIMCCYCGKKLLMERASATAVCQQMEAWGSGSRIAHLCVGSQRTSSCLMLGTLLERQSSRNDFCARMMMMLKENKCELMLSLPFLLDGLANDESWQPSPQHR